MRLDRPRSPAARIGLSGWVSRRFLGTFVVMVVVVVVLAAMVS
ncbi:MAG: hypothetical protein RIE77_06890 [Phycisphaerales bacterium]